MEKNSLMSKRKKQNRKLTYFAEKWLKPYPFAGEDISNRVYAQLVDYEIIQDDNRKQYIINISLVNDAMLDTDYAYFSNNQSDLEVKVAYKPYYYEFTAKVDETEYEKLIHTVGHQWFSGRLISTKKLQHENFLTGVVEFSASPFKGEKTYLEYNNDELSEEAIKKLEIYEINIDPLNNITIDKIHPYLKLAFVPAKMKVKVYNVGQANFVYMKGGTGSVLFDVGMPRDPSEGCGRTPSIDLQNKEVQKSMAAIRLIRPKLVILSHWDLDHIKGVYLLEEGAFKNPWIAPEDDYDKTLSAKRLVKYLDYNKMLYLISKADFAGKLVCGNEQYKLWKGDGVSRSANAKNNGGLILELNHSEKSTILAGDCEYLSWPDQLSLKMNKYLVVPHHGAEMKFDGIQEPDEMEGRKAYISVGEDEALHHYGHPAKVHVDKLISWGYEVWQTIEQGTGVFNIDLI